MTEKLEVDGFEIDIETLANSDNPVVLSQYSVLAARLARQKLAEMVMANLTPESKKRFEEYQEQNNPCK